MSHNRACLTAINSFSNDVHANETLPMIPILLSCYRTGLWTGCWVLDIKFARLHPHWSLHTLKHAYTATTPLDPAHQREMDILWAHSDGWIIGTSSIVLLSSLFGTQKGFRHHPPIARQLLGGCHDGRCATCVLDTHVMLRVALEGVLSSVLVMLLSCC